MENFITVAFFQYPHEIAILKTILDDEGIVYYFDHEVITSVVPFYSLALGGIQLKIQVKDKEKVTAILASLAIV